MARQGFDTWIVEVRGAGLSRRVDQKWSTEEASTPSKQYNVTESTPINGQSCTTPEERKQETLLVGRLTDTFMRLAQKLSGYINESQLREISNKFFDQMSKLLEDVQLSQKFEEVHEKILGLLEAGQNSTFSGQIEDLSERLVSIIEESQRSVSPQLFDLQGRLSTTIEDFQKQVDLIVTYNWDFDNYLDEDIPAAVILILSKISLPLTLF